MNYNEKFDGHIKDAFKNYEPDVPAHIWDNIMKEKKKRKPFFFWPFSTNSLLFIGLLLAGFTGWFMFSRDGEESSNALKFKGIKVEKVESTKVEKEENINVQEVTSLKKESSKVQEVNGSYALKNESSKVQEVNVSNTVKIESSKVQEFKGSNALENESSKVQKFKGSNAVKIESPILQVDDVPTAQSFEGSLTQQFLDVEKLSNKKSSNIKIQTKNKLDLNIPCPKNERNNISARHYVDVYVSPDYALIKMTDTANSEYLQKRKESIRFAAAYSAGFRYTHVFNNGLNIRLGLNYSQINETFEYAQGQLIQVIYITNANGDTTGSFLSTSTRYKTTHNKFRTIDLPIQAGYEINKGRFNLNFHAGAVVNLYSWQKGDVLDTGYSPINITTGKESSPYQFKNNVGLGLMGGISAYFKMSPKIYFLAEPYFRYQFSPASTSELTFKQKYHTLGFRLGARINF